MKHFSKHAALLATFLGATTAHATPTLYPNDLTDLGKIKNETTSNIIADDVSKNTLYVMPPNTGTASVSGLHTVSASILMCDQIPMLINERSRFLESIANLKARHADDQKSLDALDGQIQTAQEALNVYVADAQLQDIFSVDSQIESLQEQIEKARQALDTTAGAERESLSREISSWLAQQITLIKTRNAGSPKISKLLRIYEQKKASVDLLKMKKNQKEENFNLISSDLKKATDQVDSLYNEFSKLYGARAALTFKTSWNENVQALRTANPGYDFELLSTSEVGLYPQLKGLPGLAGEPVIGMDMAGDNSEPNQTGIHLAVFPSGLQGNIVLSLIGACPMVRPDLFKGNAASYDPLNMKYGMIATYQFPSTMRLKMTATYNLYSLYQKTQEMKKKGGLFSSHSHTSIEERQFLQDAFSVNWSSQDPQNQITDDQRLKMEQDVREDLMERIFKSALIGTKNPSALGELPETSAHGATAIADSLLKACPASAVCTAGAGVINALDLVFGHSSSSLSVSALTNVNATETWEMDKVVMKPWITSYQF